MKTIGNLIEGLFKKIGVDPTKVDILKPLLELPTEIADEYATKLETSLLTVEAAKSNPEVLKVLRQSILSPLDDAMNSIIKEKGLHPGEEFAIEKNTYLKLPMLAKLIEEETAKKAVGQSKEGVNETLKKQSEEFERKEAGYQSQLKEMTEGIKKKENEFSSTRADDLRTFEVHKKLLGKKYSFPEKMDINVKVNSAYGVISTELAKKGWKIIRDEIGQLKIVDKDDSPVYNDKRDLVQTDSFFDAALAENGLLQINDPQQQSNINNGAAANNNGNAFNNGNSNNRQRNNAAIQELETQIQNLPA